jgi:2'-phosphotransferase
MPADEEDYGETQERMESLALKGKGGGRGGRRGAPAAGGSASDQKNRDFQISKALSLLLRHKAAEAGVDLDNEGFARLDKVVSSSILS